jgi:hypothetical protein
VQVEVIVDRDCVWQYERVDEDDLAVATRGSKNNKQRTGSEGWLCCSYGLAASFIFIQTRSVLRCCIEEIEESPERVRIGPGCPRSLELLQIIEEVGWAATRRLLLVLAEAMRPRAEPHMLAVMVIEDLETRMNAWLAIGSHRVQCIENINGGARQAT